MGEQLAIVGIVKMDIKLTPEQLKRIADLKIQSMMFDMDIDWETGSLVLKRITAESPGWLKKWKDKINASDIRLYEHEH